MGLVKRIKAATYFWFVKRSSPVSGTMSPVSVIPIEGNVTATETGPFAIHRAGRRTPWAEQPNKTLREFRYAMENAWQERNSARVSLRKTGENEMSNSW